MASNESATAKMRAASGISSPRRPSGYPRPSQRSWWCRTISTAPARNAIGATICAPIDGMVAHHRPLLVGRAGRACRGLLGHAHLADVVQEEPVADFGARRARGRSARRARDRSLRAVQMSSRRAVLGLDHLRERLHRRDVGLLEALEDPLELRGAGALEPVEVAELPGEHDQLLVDCGQLGVRVDRRRLGEARRLFHGWGRTLPLPKAPGAGSG